MRRDSGGIGNAFTGDFGRHRAGRSAHFGLRHRYLQGRGGHGASLQPGGAGAVRNAGTYNTRENQAKCFDFQSCLRPRIHRLCAGLRLCAQRRKGLRSGLLAAAGHTVRYESHRPILG